MTTENPGPASDTMPPLFSTEERGDALVLTIAVNQVDDSNADRLRYELEQAAAAISPPQIVLSLESVDYLSSAGLGVFIAYRQGIDRAGGKLRLCSLQNNIAQVFRLTKLNLAFEIHADKESALASF